MSRRQAQSHTGKWVPRSGAQESPAEPTSVRAEASETSRASGRRDNRRPQRRRSDKNEETNSNSWAPSLWSTRACPDSNTRRRHRSGHNAWNEAPNTASGEALPLEQQPQEQQSNNHAGETTMQPCASAACKYVRTWHHSYCCESCMWTCGREHGTFCDKRSQQEWPGDLREPIGDSASSAALVEASSANTDPSAKSPRGTSASAIGNLFSKQEWQEITAMPTARHSFAVAVTETAVYCIGGTGAEQSSSVVERFWGTQGWDTACDLPSPRHGLAAVALAGSIYVAGGGDENGQKTNTAWRMNLRRGKKDWKEVKPMQTPRMNFALVGHDQRVYALGGTDLTLVEYFDVEDPWGPWLPMPAIQAPKTNLAAVALDGVLYALGGQVNGRAVPSVEAFDTRAKDKWCVIPKMPSPRHSFGAAAVSAQHICIAGGCNGRHVLRSVECFDVVTQTWSREVPLPKPRSRLAFVGPFDGSVMVFGGANQGSAIAAVHSLKAQPEMPDSSGEGAIEQTGPSNNRATRAKQRQRDATLQHEDEALLARLTPPDQVPPFHPDANGTAKEWNHGLPPLYWGKYAKQVFGVDEDSDDGVEDPDVNTVMRFFELRAGPNGHPVRDLIGEPEPQEGGWWRCQWKAFPGVEKLPDSSQGEHAWDGKSDWHRAWHGCKFESLYSIMYHGRLFASDSEAMGHRMLTGAPGVYVHKDSTGQKVASYYRFVPLCRDGTFWAPKWELYVDRSDRVAKGGTDQWVQQPRSVRLSALWLCGRTAAQMEESDEVARWWDPLMEANPCSPIWTCQNVSQQTQADDSQNGAADSAHQPNSDHGSCNPCVSEQAEFDVAPNEVVDSARPAVCDQGDADDNSKPADADKDSKDDKATVQKFTRQALRSKVCYAARHSWIFSRRHRKRRICQLWKMAVSRTLTTQKKMRRIAVL